MKLDRRNFIGSSAAIAAALTAPTVMASGKPRVVVVGMTNIMTFHRDFTG